MRLSLLRYPPLPRQTPSAVQDAVGRACSETEQRAQSRIPSEGSRIVKISSGMGALSEMISAFKGTGEHLMD
jgi:hypothetical protein